MSGPRPAAPAVAIKGARPDLDLLAYVTTGDVRVRVRWRRTSSGRAAVRCDTCGMSATPVCPHARAVVAELTRGSDDLRQDPRPPPGGPGHVTEGEPR